MEGLKYPNPQKHDCGDVPDGSTVMFERDRAVLMLKLDHNGEQLILSAPIKFCPWCSKLLVVEPVNWLKP